MHTKSKPVLTKVVLARSEPIESPSEAINPNEPVLRELSSNADHDAKALRQLL